MAKLNLQEIEEELNQLETGLFFVREHIAYGERRIPGGLERCLEWALKDMVCLLEAAGWSAEDILAYLQRPGFRAE